MPTPTGLRYKTTPSRAPVTEADMEWPLYFCNVKNKLGQNIWDLLPPSLGGKKAGEGVTIVHPDTGYTDHPELKSLDLARSKNFLESKLPAIDPLAESFMLFPNHGSATAGVMVSEPGHPNDPALGVPQFPAYTVPASQFVTGFAPKAKLIPCRVTSSVVLTGDSIPALAKALYYAVSLSRGPPIDFTIGVVSISLGCLPGEPVAKHALGKALAHARNSGIVICGAAGQVTDWSDAIMSPRYPGTDKNVLCVAACNSTHGMLSSGHYGPEVDITAPGVKIWKSTTKKQPGGGLTYSIEQSDGSSYATAIVAAACALWQAHHERKSLIANYGSKLIFDLFRWALFESCDTRFSTWDTTKHGHGVLDVEALLSKPLDITPAQLQAWAATH